MAMDGTRSHSKPTRNRKPGSELSWLMRTSYISNEVDTKTKQQVSTSAYPSCAARLKRRTSLC